MPPLGALIQEPWEYSPGSPCARSSSRRGQGLGFLLLSQRPSGTLHIGVSMTLMGYALQNISATTVAAAAMITKFSLVMMLNIFFIAFCF